MAHSATCALAVACAVSLLLWASFDKVRRLGATASPETVTVLKLGADKAPWERNEEGRSRRVANAGLGSDGLVESVQETQSAKTVSEEDRDIEAKHKLEMCRDPVMIANLDCHILVKVPKLDPYLLRRQHASGQLPAVPFSPEKDCERVMHSKHHKLAYDKINIAPHRREGSHGARILCMLVTVAASHDTDLLAVRTTWGYKCDGFIAFSNKLDPNVSAIQTPVVGGDTYKNLSEKMRSAFKYVWYHYGHKFDWFVKADHDTLLIPENLVQYLLTDEIQAARMSGKGVYLGHRLFNKQRNVMYASGGAGYVLDRVALRELVHNMDKSRGDLGRAEDVEVGYRLSRSGITAYNATDAKDEEMFHLFGPRTTVRYTSSSGEWYLEFRPMGVKTGLEAVSVNTTSFHRMKGELQVEAHNYLHRCKGLPSTY